MSQTRRWARCRGALWLHAARLHAPRLRAPRLRALWLRALGAVAVAAGALCAALPAWAADAPAPLSGTRQVLMVDAQGQRTVIGQVLFTPGEGGATRFQFKLDEAPFTVHFLSMREFRCLPGATELTCQVPYPYAQPGTVKDGEGGSDYAWLEHSLMFFFKRPADYGAKLWNGIYFALRREGNALVGTPQAVDLNRIAAPPDRAGVPPYGKAQRDEMPADQRWFRQLRIE